MITPRTLFHLCSKKLFSAVHKFVHLNLAIALFIGYFIFAVGVELPHNDKVKPLDIGMKYMVVVMITLK